MTRKRIEEIRIYVVLWYINQLFQSGYKQILNFKEKTGENDDVVHGKRSTKKSRNALKGALLIN